MVAEGALARVRDRAAMLFVMVGGPAVPVLQITAYYVVVPIGCNYGDLTWPAHLVSLVALAAVGAAIAVSWRGWRRGRDQRRSGDDDPRVNGERSFVYAVGLGGSALGAIAVGLMAITVPYFDPCAGDHEFRLL